MLELILGGARSGKSRHALALAAASGEPFILVVTAEARDQEMTERIAAHRASRSDQIQVIESPLQLAASLRQVPAGAAVVVDCLTLWLSNCLEAGSWPQERAALLQVLALRSGATWLVSNEVGSGIVPLGRLPRLFADEAGRLHQELAAMAARVTLLVAGLPLILKATHHVK